jgi:hypothetical protein
MRSMNRRSLALAWTLALSLAAAGTLGGCGTTVVPPQARLSDPVPVYVADYGVHSSLLLPTPDGRFVEYNFGDWGYAAENRTMPQDAVGALLVSFQSGLGRRFFDLKPGEAEPKPAERPSRMNKVYCERNNVYELVRRLDQRYQAALKTQKPLRNPENGLEFVRDTERYGFANNCNHMTARSLEQLGCKVRGLVVSSKFDVARAEPAAGRKAEPAVPGWNTAMIE